jgi:hypothetical protein
MPPFFDFLAIQKIIKKSTPQKIDFFGNFGDFCYFFLQFLTILGPFWGPQEGKSENRDFVKIVLPPRREHDFQGSDPPKIDLESRKTTFAAKIDEKALPGTAFWGKSRFLVIFGLPGGTQKLLKIYDPFPVKGSWEPSGSHFGRFSAFFSILAPLLVHSGSILGPPGSIFSRFL